MICSAGCSSSRRDEPFTRQLDVSRDPKLFLGRLDVAGGMTKTFPLRGIKDSAPYLHDGRLLTLDDTVEYFNLILQLKLNEQEKKDLVAFMLAL